MTTFSRTAMPLRPHSLLLGGAHVRPTLVVVALLLTAHATVAAIQVSPSVVRPVVKAGQGAEFVLIVTNGDPTSRAFEVSVMNMTGAPQGYPVRSPEDDPRGCARWLDISPQSFTLGPSLSQKVTCRVQAPRNAKGGYYALISVRSPSPEATAAGPSAGITLAQVFGTAVLVAVPGPQVAPKLKVEGIRIGLRPASASGQGGWRVEAGVRNEGTLHAKVVGAYTLRSTTGALASRGALDSGAATVLASALRVFTGEESRSLTDGVYVVNVQFGVPGTRIRTTGAMAFSVQAGVVKEVDATPEVAALLDSQRPAAQLSPPEIVVTAPPGSQTSRPVTLTNAGKTPLRLLVSCSDFQLTETGDEDFPEGAPEHQRSAKGWVSLEPQEVEVAAGGRTTIRMTVSIPKDARGDYFAGLRVRANTTPPGPFYPAYTVVRVSAGRDNHPSCEVSDLVVTQPNAPDAAVTAEIRNTGDCIIWPVASLDVTDAEGKSAVSSATLATGNVMVLPGQKRRFTMPLDCVLRPGQCHATVTAIARENGKAVQREIAFDAPVWEREAAPQTPPAETPTP